MTLVRFPDWQSRLHDYLFEHAVTEFRYGVFDCCLFACDAILATTGTDVAAPFRGRYASRRAAFRTIEEFAGRASVEAITERVTRDHGMPETTPTRAQRGDVALLPRTHDYSLALVSLAGDLLAAGARGYERVPLKQAYRAWRV